MSDLVTELRKIALLAGIEDAQLERVAAVVSQRSLDPKEVLVAQGSIGEDLYFVKTGRFAVSILDGDKTAIVAELGPGDVIGETQLIAGGRRTATVTALEPCEVLCLPHAEFDALVVASESLRNSVARVIRHRLREAALRVALPRAVGSDPQLLDLLSKRANWVRLERGETLWDQGDAASHWYVMVSGELSRMVSEHGTLRLIETIRRGEVFGETALIRGTTRSTTTVARRDCWLARFDRALLDDEILNRTGALQALVRSLADRLSTNPASGQGSAQVITLLPQDSGLEMQEFTSQLSDCLGAQGQIADPAAMRRDGVVGDAVNLPSEHPGWLRFEAWVETQRQDGDFVLLVTNGEDNPWTRACVAQADRVLLLVDADSSPARSGSELTVLEGMEGSQAASVWLVLMHSADREMPSGTAAWLEPRTVSHHAHVRRGNRRDMARLARWLNGQTRGIALSGGGARGFVHLGVVAAMYESGYEIDLIAGTSAGAMAGGLLARGESPEPMMEAALKIIEAAGNPFVEFDLPLISILRSQRMREGLHGTYRETAIEDSWIPLRIVVTDLTESRRKVFDRGLVWERVLAASSPPGIMAPVMDEGHLLCDGGLVDNLPVSILQEHNCQEYWASYVGSVPELPAPLRGFPSSWALLMDKILRRKRHHDVPSLLTTMFQCVTVPAAAQLENARASATVFFQPDLAAFSVTDIDSAREMFQAGYVHAMEVLSTLEKPTDDAI